ncbi:MAG: NIL domain-containing protein [Nanoarchaeota archaeon]
MISKKLVLKFPKEVGDKPIVYKLIKDYNLVFNILKAEVSPDREGRMVMELTGEQKDIDKGIKYLKESKVGVEPLSKDIDRDEKKCTHCSACIVHCPTHALYIKDRKTMEVGFDKSKCILCEACIPICPVNAMKINY